MSEQPFHDYPSFKKWLDEWGPTDKWGFDKPVPGESIAEEIERLESNLAWYRSYMQYRTKLPPEIHEARKADFLRLREIRKPRNEKSTDQLVSEAHERIEKHYYTGREKR